MLNERRATASSHDPARRTARLEVGSASGATQEKETKGTALLDSKGALVGVDVEPNAASRVVVMLGKHEQVARTTDARLTVVRDAKGEVVSVVVHGL